MYNIYFKLNPSSSGSYQPQADVGSSLLTHTKRISTWPINDILTTKTKLMSNKY